MIQEDTETIYAPFYGGISEIEVPRLGRYTLINELMPPQSEPLPNQLEIKAIANLE